MKITLKKVDENIWKSDLREFLPGRIIDFHCHIFNPRYLPADVRTKSVFFRRFRTHSLDKQVKYDRILLPGKKVHYVVTGWPIAGSDLQKQNEFIRKEKHRHENARYLMLVEPGMDTRYIVKTIEEKCVSGFKPYKCYSGKNPENSGITDFLPAEQIAIADRYGLVITLHLSRKGGIGDRTNFDDLLRLSDRYPDVAWNMAHCGRSFIPAHLESACRRLHELKGRRIYFDTAAVSDSEVFSILLSEIGAGKILYGSDNPVGLLRGRCVEFGYDWFFMTEDKFSLAGMKESFGGIEPTFTLYEELRALKRACRRARLSKKDVADIFYGNAERILTVKRQDFPISGRSVCL